MVPPAPNTVSHIKIPPGTALAMKSSWKKHPSLGLVAKESPLYAPCVKGANIKQRKGSNLFILMDKPISLIRDHVYGLILNAERV